MKSPDAPINEDEEFKMAVELSFWHRVYMYLSGRGYQRNACGQMATHIDRLFDEYSMTKELEATVIEDNLRIAELEQELAVERESNEAFSNRIEELHKQNQRIRDSYYDLIMQVAIKHPNESRHETAKRYITQSENHCNGPEAKQALEGRDEIT